MINILTIDVEDYPALYCRDMLGREVPVSDRVVVATRCLLDVLEGAVPSATFFCLGSVAEAHPELIREIRRRGHEIASHGMRHIPFRQLTRAEIRDDISRAKAVLEDLLGEPIQGLRAPQFSVGLDRPEILECIREAGYVYDSSIFPFAGWRYGSAESPRRPYLINTPSGPLVEYPLSTLSVFGRRLPVGGGGYLRHFPYCWNRWAIRKLNREGTVAVVYVHPHECDTVPCAYSGRGLAPARRLRAAFYNAHQYHGRAGMVDKIRALIGDFEFSSIAAHAEAQQQVLDYVTEAVSESGTQQCAAVGPGTGKGHTHHG
jgi:polysaccharide deacetylase family protein (PEP-CTERM system associated)